MVTTLQIKMTKILVLLTAIILGLSLCGCASTTTKSSEENETTQEENIFTIGQGKECEYFFQAMNESGKDVKSIQIKTSTQEEWSTNLIADKLWENEHKAKLEFSQIEQTTSQETPEGGHVVIKPVYDLQITLSDDTVYIIHNIPVETLNGASEGHFKIDASSELAYFVFDGVKDFSSTLENDKQIKENEIKAAEETKRAEEEAAAARAAAEAGQSYSYNSNSGSSSVGTSRNTGGSSQSQNDCIGGFVTK